MLQLIWLTCAVAIVAAAARAGRSPTAARIGRLAVGTLYLGAGALVNAAFLASGEDYADFADHAYIRFVRETWESLVVPNHVLFISLLVVFEATVGVLVLGGGRRTQVGLSAAIAFHVALLSFGWWFYLWSIPMIGALSLLLRAERRPTAAVVELPVERPKAA